MRTILKTAMLSIFILTLAAIARPQEDGAAKMSADILTETKMTGAWQINYAESDNPIEKVRTMLQSKLRQPATEETVDKTNEPPMSVSLVPPETLVIADGFEKSVTINEGFNEIVFTRTVAADGVLRTGDFQNGAIFSLMAERNGDSLKIETESPRKNRMIETYTLAGKGKKLIVTVRFEDAQAKEIITFRRVYDRTSADIFITENQDFQ